MGPEVLQVGKEEEAEEPMRAPGCKSFNRAMTWALRLRCYCCPLDEMSECKKNSSFCRLIWSSCAKPTLSLFEFIKMKSNYLVLIGALASVN